MRILLTNDDGIDSPGLQALVSLFSPDHDVWVVAPDGERSGMSHSVQLKGPIVVQKRGPQRFAISGSPADCVFLAFRGTFCPPVDAIVSGINTGPNLGTDIIYSGTCAAARQAALLGKPAIAVSLDVHGAPWNFDDTVQFLEASWAKLLRTCPPGTFWNVNVPAIPLFPLQSVECVPCVRKYQDSVLEYVAPNGDLFCWVRGEISPDGIDESSDWAAVRQGKISISSILAQPQSAHTLTPAEKTPTGAQR